MFKMTTKTTAPTMVNENGEQKIIVALYLTLFFFMFINFHRTSGLIHFLFTQHICVSVPQILFRLFSS